MKVLNKAECKEVVRLTRNGIPKGIVMATMGVSSNTITRIGACVRHDYPLEDYMIFDRPDYHLKPLGEKMEAWDLRLSLRMQRLPFSQWAAAL